MVAKKVELIISAKDESTAVIKQIRTQLKEFAAAQKAFRGSGAGAFDVIRQLGKDIKVLKGQVGAGGVFGKINKEIGGFKTKLKGLVMQFRELTDDKNHYQAQQKQLEASIKREQRSVDKLTKSLKMQKEAALATAEAQSVLRAKNDALGKEKSSLTDARTAPKGIDNKVADSAQRIQAANELLVKNKSLQDKANKSLAGLIQKEKELSAAQADKKTVRRSKQIGKVNEQIRAQKKAIRDLITEENQQNRILAKQSQLNEEARYELALHTAAVDTNANAQSRNNEKIKAASALEDHQQAGLKETNRILAERKSLLSSQKNNLYNTGRSLESSTYNRVETGKGITALKQSLRELGTAGDKASAELSVLGDEFRKDLNPAIKEGKAIVAAMDSELEELTAQYALLANKSRTQAGLTAKEKEQQVALLAALTATTSARRQAAGALGGLIGQSKDTRIKDIPARSNDINAAVVGTDILDRAQRDAIKSSEALAKSQDRLDKKYEDVASSARKAAGSTRAAGAAQREYNRSAGQSIGLLRSLRTHVLAATSAWIGLHAVFRGLGEVVGSLKKVEAAQNRLRVVVGDDQVLIAESLDFVRRSAERLGIEFGMLAQEYTKFSISTQGTLLEGEKTRKIFLSVSEAARVNNASTDDLKGTYLALIQIISKGRITMEELKRQLGDRLPGAVHIMAAALGVGTDELLKIVEAGDLSSDKLVEFADELDRRFGPGLAGALRSTQALIGKLQNSLFQANLRLAQGGFIDSFNELLQAIQTTLASPEFISFLDQVSIGLALITDGVVFAVEHWQGFTIAISALLGLGAAKLLLRIGNSIRTMGLFAGFAKPQVAALGDGMAVATVQAGRLATGFRTLGRVLKTNLFGLVFTAAITLASAAFATMNTRATEANKTLAEHKRIVDEVKNAWDEANGGQGFDAFVKTLQELDKDSVLNNALKLKVEFDLQKDGLVGGIRDLLTDAQGKQSSALNSTGFYTELEKSLKKILPVAEKYNEAITGGKNVDEINKARKAFLAEIGNQTGILSKNGFAADSLAMFENFADTTNALSDIAQKSGFADVLAEFKDTGNVQGIVNWLTTAKDTAIAISQLGSKVEGAGDKFQALGDTAPKGVAKIKGQLDAVYDGMEELEKNFGALIDNLKQSGLSTEELAVQTGIATDKFNESWGKGVEAIEALNTQLVLAKFNISELGVVGFVADQLRGDDTSNESAQRAAAQAQSAKNIAQSKVKGFDALPQTTQAILTELEAYDKLTKSIAQNIENGRFDLASSELINASFDEHGGVANQRLADLGEGLSANQPEIIAFLVKKNQLTADEAKIVADGLAATQEQIKLQRLVNAGKEREAFILEGITSLQKAANKDNGRGLSPEEEKRQRLALGQLYDLQNVDKASGKSAKERAEAERAKLQALIALRELERQQFAIKRGEVARAGGNTETDAGLNRRRDVDALRGGQIDDLSLKVLDMFKALKDQSPEVVGAIREIELQLKAIRVESGLVKASILSWEDGSDLLQGSILDGFDTFLEKISEGVKGFRALEDAFLSFAASFLTKIGDIFLELAAKDIVNKLGDLLGFTIGGGSAVGGFVPSSAFGNIGDFLVKHEGGIVNGTGKHRSLRLPTSLQGYQDPRFHRGGFPGLAPNETRAILEKGELVTPKDDVQGLLANAAAGAAGGKGGMGNLQINNMIVSGDVVASGIAAEAGRTAIFNLIAKERKTINAILGG